MIKKSCTHNENIEEQNFDKKIYRFQAQSMLNENIEKIYI